MVKGQSLVTVLSVNPPHLAAPEFAKALAVLTLACKLDPAANGGGPVEFREVVKGQAERRFEFVFDPACKVDGESAADWLSHWNDEEWLAKNPQHPLTWMKHYAENYERFAEWMKAHVPVHVYRNAESSESERVAYVPADQLDTERGREILRGAGINA